MRPAIEPDAGDARDGELDGQDVALLAVRIITGGAHHRAHGAVREGFGVELSGLQSGTVVPQADRVFAGHFRTPLQLSGFTPDLVERVLIESTRSVRGATASTAG